MLNTKSYSVVDKNNIKGTIFVVGVGATGSLIVEQLARLNLTDKIVVYDDDVVEEKNKNNQAYLHEHIGMPKVKAMVDLCSKIDNNSRLRNRQERMTEFSLISDDDILVICVDNFKDRASILESLKSEPLVISGGVNSIGGNIEITRGYSKYKALANKYRNLKEEVNPNELSACGSPISIYHRIRVVASVACELIVKYSKEEIPDTLSVNYLVDVPFFNILELEEDDTI